MAYRITVYERMSMTRFECLFLAVVLLAGGSFAEFRFAGDAGILGVKNIGDLSTDNNVDVLWGRVNFISNYTDENFASALQIRVYPAGYGFDYISGATFDTSHNAIVTNATNAAKLQVIQGWVQYTLSSLKIKIGRIPLKYSVGTHFGDYAQRGPNGSFCYPGALHNATVFIHDAAMVNSQVVLGVSDKNLNTAYFLMKETVKASDKVSVSAGYHSNFFDVAYDEGATVIHALSFAADFTYMKGKKVYAELGVRDIGIEGEDVKMPFTLGVHIPTAGVLDLTTVEMEYCSVRADNDKEGLYWALYLGKNLGSHFHLRAALYNNSAGAEPGDLSAGMYFGSSFN